MYRLLLILITAVPCASYALSIDGYLEMRTAAGSYTNDTNISKFGLETYLTGISETLTHQRQENGSLLRESDPYICIPIAVEISPTLLMSVIDSEIKNNSAIYIKVLGKDWKKYTVAAMAQIGLSHMFPCQ